MAKDYGKSGQKEDQCHGSDGGGGLGSAGGQGKGDGDEIENGTAQGDCAGIHRDKKSSVNRGKANFGKILSQLRELQRSHLAYVESHEERLQARLIAAQKHHNQVIDQMNELEKEILYLLGEGEAV